MGTARESSSSSSSGAPCGLPSCWRRRWRRHWAGGWRPRRLRWLGGGCRCRPVGRGAGAGGRRVGQANRLAVAAVMGTAIGKRQRERGRERERERERATAAAVAVLLVACLLAGGGGNRLGRALGTGQRGSGHSGLQVEGTRGYGSADRSALAAVGGSGTATTGRGCEGPTALKHRGGQEQGVYEMVICESQTTAVTVNCLWYLPRHQRWHKQRPTWRLAARGSSYCRVRVPPAPIG